MERMDVMVIMCANDGESQYEEDATCEVITTTRQLLILLFLLFSLNPSKMSQDMVEET